MSETTSIINASPTKDFFIHMLTRDIELKRAILDLVDNSIDGAKKQSQENLSNYWIRIDISNEKLTVSDNCGGISIETARDYAFRFGRDKNAPPSKNSVGQFGVGMKRALFKIGQSFNITSKTKSSHFTIVVDVEKWKKDEMGDSWHFNFSSIDPNCVNKDSEIGTVIEISNLHPQVANDFSLITFINDLKSEIESAHVAALGQWISITVNNEKLKNHPITLLVSDNLKPSYQTRKINNNVSIKIYAGISDKNIKEGGWYIFCNGRIILHADQSSKTVWAREHELRQYHANFAFFRGYVYFESEDASLLPWTTTKTGVDTDFPIYKTVQEDMIEASKPIINFLTKLSNLEKNPEDSLESELFRTVGQCRKVAINELPEQSFIAPEPSPKDEFKRKQKIQYYKLIEEIEKVKTLLKASSFAEIGSKTFDYFLEYEGKD